MRHVNGSLGPAGVVPGGHTDLAGQISPVGPLTGGVPSGQLFGGGDIQGGALLSGHTAGGAAQGGLPPPLGQTGRGAGQGGLPPPLGQIGEMLLRQGGGYVFP